MERKNITAFSIAILILFSSFQQKKPLKLFLLGDSISLQYGSYLETYLKGHFAIERKGSQETALKNLDVPIDANGGDSKMVLNYLRTRENDPVFKPDLLILNCGLHDIKRNPVTKQIATDSGSYRDNLEAIYSIISKKKIPLIWVRSTEVIDTIHARKSKAFDRYSKDLEQYNAIADQVFQKHEVQIIDLYDFTSRTGHDRFADHVHFVPRVVDAQASFIAGFLMHWKVKQMSSSASRNDF